MRDRLVATTRTPIDLTGGAAVSTASRTVERLAAGGVTLAIYLPDSVLTGVTRTLEADPRIPTIVCTREDEGMAIACGASIAGGLPVVLMEGSGVGYGGLILARAQVQRSGFLLIASHSPALGEAFDYHAASRVVGAAVLGGLGIPFVVPRSGDELVDLVGEALVTVRGQRAVVGILVPPSVLR
jgi:sulfopyruvate decarboxylase TPP-binding subunit